MKTWCLMCKHLHWDCIIFTDVLDQVKVRLVSLLLQVTRLACVVGLRVADLYKVKMVSLLSGKRKYIIKKIHNLSPYTNCTEDRKVRMNGYRLHEIKVN